MKKIADKSSYKQFAEVMTKEIPLIELDYAVRLTKHDMTEFFKPHKERLIKEQVKPLVTTKHCMALETQKYYL